MIPATNQLSLPEVMKQTLHHNYRKQVHSWLCCWSAYPSLYSISLCLRGHLHPTWPESAWGYREGVGFEWCLCLIGHQNRFLKEPCTWCFFFPPRNIFKWSFSVCDEKSWNWERYFPHYTFNDDAKSCFILGFFETFLFSRDFFVTFITSCLYHCSTDVHLALKHILTLSNTKCVDRVNRS